MEQSQYFTYLVLGISVTHLIWQAGEHIGSWWDIRKDNRSRNTAVNQGQVQQRSDWYAFFHCSDLYGPDPIKKGPASVEESRTGTPRKSPRPQIRPNAL
jgi:hypothetical protein